MKHRLPTILFGLLLCVVPLRAQWSGSLDLSGGLGGMEGSLITEGKPVFHVLAQGTFQLDYKTDKFGWKTTLNGKWEPNVTDNTRASFKKEKLGVVYKATATKPLTISLRQDFAWKPVLDRNYSAWILYQYSNDRGHNHTMNFDGNSDEINKISYYYEVPVKDEHKVESGVRTFRNFNDGRNVLQSSLTLQLIHSQRVNTWIVFKTDDPGNPGATAVDIEDVASGYAWKYRITPSSTDFNLDGDIHLQNTVLEGDVQLKWTPGVRLSTKHALDQNSGATQIGYDPDGKEENWRDSTRLRETFDYLSVLAEPYVTADFKWDKLEAHLDYACQVYGRRLNDDTHQQPLKIKGVYPVGKANVKWNMAPGHSLNLSNQMSVSHPDYIKVCWYDRTAGYMDQLYRGNEQLLSPMTRRYALAYEFKAKRFLSNTSLSFTRVVNEIDQTWSNEEIEGRQYKVFRWLNAADSWAGGLSQSFGWRGKVITANASITYNQTRRVSRTNGTVKNNFDWRATADIAANLGRGWTIKTDAKYQSKVATFFTLFKEYCELNARVQKEFKHITLFLEGRHILDTPRETSFESDELQEYWVEEVRSNRRIFILGLKWKF